MRRRIKHTFEEYSGDHSSNVPQRVKGHLFPFFSHALEFDD